MVSFTDAVKLFFKRYGDFQGRSSRSEYWWIQLFNILVMIVPMIMFFGVVGADPYAMESGDVPPGAWLPLILIGLYGLVIIIPSIALVVRRFHDLNQTGWLYLIFIIVGLIPLVGMIASIAMVIWFCFRGTIGPNKYGPDPLDPNNDLRVFD